MARAKRKMTGTEHVRMFEYMASRDKAYVLCVYAKMHEALVKSRTPDPRIRTAVDAILGAIGLPGRILTGVLKALDKVQADVSDCVRVIRRGPSARS